MGIKYPRFLKSGDLNGLTTSDTTSVHMQLDSQHKNHQESPFQYGFHGILYRYYRKLKIWVL